MEEVQKFGRLTPLENCGPYWRFRCDCGNECLKHIGSVRRGDTRSCGCLRREVSAARKLTHGKCRTPEYVTWMNIVARCTNKNNTRYPRYGGAGITVCDRWLADFAAFYADMGPRPSPDHSIDRCDNDGNYEPGNCRWATRTEQARNKNNNRLVCVDGEEMPLVEAAERAGRDYQLVHRRLKEGWPLDRALSTPTQDGKPRPNRRVSSHA